MLQRANGHRISSEHTNKMEKTFNLLSQVSKWWQSGSHALKKLSVEWNIIKHKPQQVLPALVHPLDKNKKLQKKKKKSAQKNCWRTFQFGRKIWAISLTAHLANFGSEQLALRSSQRGVPSVCLYESVCVPGCACTCVCECQSCHQTERAIGNAKIMDYAKLLDAQITLAPSTYWTLMHSEWFYEQKNASFDSLVDNIFNWQRLCSKEHNCLTKCQTVQQLQWFAETILLWHDC